MARLEIRLLGGFDVCLLGRPVVEFESDTVRALLARVAAEPGRTITRASLAELLWPGRAQGAALGNLRHALTVLRRAIGDEATDRPFLTVTPTHLTADGGADVWIDVVELERVATGRGSERRSVADWEHANPRREATGPEQLGQLERGRLRRDAEVGPQLLDQSIGVGGSSGSPAIGREQAH